MHIRTKLILLSIILTSVTMFLVGSLTIIQSSEALAASHIGHMGAIASLQQERIKEAVAQSVERISLLQASARLKDALQVYSLDRNAAIILGTETLKEIQIIYPDFKEIHLLDSNGVILFSTSTIESGAFFSRPLSFSFEEALRAPGISPVFLDENRSPFLYVFTPIQSSNEDTSGLVLARQPADLLVSIAHETVGLGETGENMIVQAEEDGDIVFITPPRFPSQRVEFGRMAAVDASPLIIAATKGHVTVFESEEDYRGVQVLATTRFLEGVNWGLITKMDVAEAQRPIEDLRNLIILADGIALVLIVMIVLVVAESIASPITRLTRIANDISHGVLDVEVDPRLKKLDDEVGDLARSFDRTMVSLKLAMRQIPSEGEKLLSRKR
ncbi:MAG: HAMP domain-containing protein [Candidatus Diapherotrites archaeon]|nr:HAMP domain-containing protein [Candidatus Diapherotrites archaeon]